MLMSSRKPSMFRSLRFRMTVLNASTTVVLIAFLRIMTITWLTDTFIQSADAVLYQRLRTELVQRTLPLPSRLTNYQNYLNVNSAAYFSNIEGLQPFLPDQTPAFLASVFANPLTVGTYTLIANSDGVPISADNDISLFVLNDEGLRAAVDSPDHVDVRSIKDKQGNDIRIVTLHLPENPIRYIQVGRPMADYVSLERQLRFILLYVGLIGIIFVILASWILSGYFVAPTERAYELQKRFITNASHELRTPLSIVRASAQLALLDAPKDHPHTDLLETIVAENKHMTNMIDNLLTIARTEERIPSVDAYDLMPHVHEAVTAVERSAPGRTIHMQCTQATIMTTYDPHYISHIIRILLDNAVAHTSATADIAINCVVAAHSIEIHICDTGAGVPVEHMGTIFEPFVTYSRGTGHRGSGIGLNIAQMFARAMHADLRYQSNIPHGACFVLELPV
jgi:signal transduction histidine kinase